MELLKLRQRMNDSNLGQRVNKTFLGIVVEGASRGLYDGFQHLKFAIKNFYPKSPINLLANAVNDVVMRRYNEMLPENCYSRTSVLWEEYEAEDGTVYMRRVPVREVLQFKR